MLDKRRKMLSVSSVNSSILTEKVSGIGVVGWESSYNAEIKDVVVKGAGEQEKLEGKNLFDKGNLRPSALSKNLLQTENGFNFERTSTRETSSVSCGIFLSAGVYYIKGDVFQSDGLNGGWSLYDIDNKVFIKNDSSRGYVRGSFTVSESKEYSLSFYCNYTSTEDTTVFYENIQIEKGETPTPYEPYCGGIPAPNPQYPIEPVFGGECELASRGKNLLNNKEFEWRNNDEGDLIAYWHRKNGLLLKANTTYTMSCSEEMFLYIQDFETLKELVTPKQYKVTYTPNKDILVCFQVYIKTGLPLNTIDIVQFEIGSTPTPYEPYFDGGTVQVPVLRALPDGSVKDEWDATTGVLTRRIGIFEPKSDMSVTQGNNKVYLNVDKNWVQLSGISTHFINKINVLERQFAKTDVLYIGWNEGAEKFKIFLDTEEKSGRPVIFWYALADPIIEQYDPAVIRQHPGYTQLIQQGGTLPAQIEAEVYK